MIWFVVAYLFGYLRFPVWVVAIMVVAGIFKVIGTVNRASKRIYLEEKMDLVNENFVKMAKLNKSFADDIEKIIVDIRKEIEKRGKKD
jgi:hypothetical protein